MVFRRSKAESNRARGQVGVTLFDDGVAIAHVTRLPNEPATLKHYAYRTVLGEDKRQETLNALVGEMGLSGLPTVLVLSQRAYHFFLIEEPKVDAAELGEAVCWKVKDDLDYPLEDAVTDYLQVPKDRPNHRSRMVYVVAAKRSTIDRYAHMIQSSGLALEVIDVSECGFRNVMQAISEDGARALLMLRADYAGIMMIGAGRIYMIRHLELDTTPLFADLQADAFSRNRVYADIAREVQRSLEYCAVNLYPQRPLELLITPSEQEDSMLLRCMEQELGISARYLDVNECLKLASPLTVSEQAQLLAAIGGALRSEESRA